MVDDRKEETLDKVLTVLSDHTLRERVEILANAFMIYGLGLMARNKESNLPEHVTPEDVVETVLNDIQSNGNSLGNSLAMQGITILEWLSREE